MSLSFNLLHRRRRGWNRGARASERSRSSKRLHQSVFLPPSLNEPFVKLLLLVKRAFALAVTLSRASAAVVRPEGNVFEKKSANVDVKSRRRGLREP